MNKGRVLVVFGLWWFFVANAQARPMPEIVTNLWTKAGGGNWGEPASWSLGQVPGASHWVGVLNAGPKTIEMNAATARNAPSSLLVSHLIISNGNTVLLNNVGAPFRVHSGPNIWNGLEIGRSGALVNLGSHLTVDGLLRIQSGELGQDGGLVESLKTTHIHSGGVYRLTN